MKTAPIGSPEYLSLLQEKEALELRLLEAEKELHANRNELISNRGVIASNAKALAAKDETITLLKDYLRQAQQDRFGKSSEKGLLKDMPAFPFMDRLFDEGMEPEEESAEEADKEKKPKEKRIQKARGNRKPIDPKLPREDIIHDLEEHLKTCTECGDPLHKIGQDISEQLEVIPAKIKVLRHIRLKYGCTCEGTVVLAPLPPQPIPKSMAGPGLLAHVAVSKYADHLPLYRQEQIWKRADIDLDRATLGRWMMTIGELIAPLIELMREDILASGYIQADETTLQVLSQKNRASSQKSYMWVYKTGDEGPSKVFYEYCVTVTPS
jgi:transposase